MFFTEPLVCSITLTPSGHVSPGSFLEFFWVTASQSSKNAVTLISDAVSVKSNHDGLSFPCRFENSECPRSTRPSGANVFWFNLVHFANQSFIPGYLSRLISTQTVRRDSSPIQLGERSLLAEYCPAQTCFIQQPCVMDLVCKCTHGSGWFQRSWSASGFLSSATVE